MLLHYRDHAFKFLKLPGHVFQGRLVLDADHKELLARLYHAEPEEWCVDRKGDRLTAEQLFERSPWAWHGTDGVVKLLARFVDFRDGSALFDTPDSYHGGLYDWMQTKQPETNG